MRKLVLAIIATVSLDAVATNALATSLYDNGPFNGDYGSFTISMGQDPQAIADTFSAIPGSDAMSVDFIAWLRQSDILQTVGWAITNGNPFDGGTIIASGTASTTQSYLETVTHRIAFDVDDEQFSIGNVTLTGGSYYLELFDAQSAGNHPVNWDINSGPSTAYSYSDGSLQNLGVDGLTLSETFTISGALPSVSAAPEPSIWAMMLAGVAMIGIMLRRKRQATIVPHSASNTEDRSERFGAYHFTTSMRAESAMGRKQSSSPPRFRTYFNPPLSGFAVSPGRVDRSCSIAGR